MASAIDLIMRKFLQKHGTTWQMHLIQNWRAIVGNLHVRMCLEKIQGDTIVVGVYDSHWMQELFLLNTMLIATINKHFDQPYVKTIRLKLAKQNDRDKKKQKIPQQKDVQRDMVMMTEKHQAALAEVKDQQLQAVLSEFLRYCKN